MNGAAGLAFVFEEGADFVVGAAEMEDEGVGFALENETEVEPATTFHERRDAAEAEARVKVGLAVGVKRGVHRGEDFRTAGGGDAL
jgi:hypothetical protein